MDSDDKRNIKKACNHLEFISRAARKILDEPMSITKLASELEFLDRQASLACRRIYAIYNEKLDLDDKLKLGEEYGHL